MFKNDKHRFTKLSKITLMKQNVVLSNDLIKPIRSDKGYRSKLKLSESSTVVIQHLSTRLKLDETQKTLMT